MPSGRRTVLVGFACALAAGTLWGTTGPLSTALYAEGAQLTDVGFWRVLLATLAFAIIGLVIRRDIFHIEPRALLLVVGLGGLLVALFEVAFQYAIAGVGIAGAVVMLYTAPIIVAVLARIVLHEALTPGRIALAIVVMLGVWLTVNGGEGADAGAGARTIGIVGGMLAALSYSGTTLLARYAVPRWGSVRVLFWEILGGTAVLALLLPVAGHTPQPPTTPAGWLYVLALGAGAVLGANFFFFAALRRIDAAPTAVAASIEPVVGALLALVLFGQQLSTAGWLGLALVISGVAGGYRLEAGHPSHPVPASLPEPETAPK